MVSIHCAPLLAAILLLIPAALAQSVPTTSTGQTILDQTLSADVALPALGGQLTNGFAMAFAVATDKYPNTVSTGAVSFGFTMANALAVNGQITFTVPKGYFTNVDSTKVNTFTGASATTCKCIGTAAASTDVMTCTIAGAALAAGAVTLSMAVGALTTGAPTDAKTYNVQTSVDRALASAPATSMIGDQITTLVAPVYSAASVDQVPFTLSTGTLAIGFTVVTPVPIGGKISLSFPKNYLSAVSSAVINTFAGKTRATSCVLTAATGTATVDTVVCTTTIEVLAAGAQLITFIAGSLTTGGPVAIATGGIKVATSTDRESAAGVDTVALGGVFAAFPTAITAANAPGVATTVAIPIVFLPVNAVPIGGKITIAFPPKFLSAVDATFTMPFTVGSTTATAKCVLTAGAVGTNPLDVTSGDTVVCTTSVAPLTVTSQTLSFSIGSVIMGVPQIAGTFNVATSTDRFKPSSTAATPVLGSILAVFPTAITAANAPGIANTVAIPVIFTPVTVVPIGGKVTIAFPPKFLSAVDSSATLQITNSVAAASAKCVLTAGVTNTAVLGVSSADTVVCTTTVAALTAVAQTLTFSVGSVTMGVPQIAGTFNVATSTDLFKPSSTAASPALGGVITAGTAVLTVATADKVPFQLNTALITIAFTTTVSTLPSGGKITISLPKNYVIKVDASKVNVITSTTSCTCALTPATGVDVTDTIICTTSGDAVAVGAGTLVFAIGTITTGGATAVATGGLSFGTSMHASATGDTVLLGGANVAVPTAGVALTFTNADDRVPGKFTSNNNTITLGLKTSSTGPLPIGSTITLTFPQNYFSKVDATKDNTVGTSATAKCTLASAQSSLPAAIALDKTTVSTSGAALTVSFVPATVTGVTQLAIPFAGFALDTASAALCTANCQNANGAGKVTAALANGVLTFTLAADGVMLLKNKLTTFTVSLVTTPSVAWATTGITATSFNPSTTVVCTTALAAIAVSTEVVFSFVAGSVTIGSGQKVSTFQIETSSDLPMASAAATVALGGGLSAGRALAFANAQDAIPGKVNTGAVSLGANLATSVPIGGQFLLTFPSNYFTAVNPSSVVTLTKGTRRSLLQTSTLSCVRTAGATVDQITCTLAGAASGTGAVVLTFPAGSLTTGLPTTTSGGFNLATANPPAAGAARVPYFPKAAGSAYGVASLLVALSALLACL